LIVVFQPHRYSRTKALYDRFVISFNHADMVIVAPIYGAGERTIEGVDSEWLLNGIRKHGHREVVLASGPDEILEKLKGLVRAGDVVMTLGAGDIHRVGDALLGALEAGGSDSKT
jgi:UDP-N-acetylmuramate--alanine ligase